MTGQSLFPIPSFLLLMSDAAGSVFWPSTERWQRAFLLGSSSGSYVQGPGDLSRSAARYVRVRRRRLAWAFGRRFHHRLRFVTGGGGGGERRAAAAGTMMPGETPPAAAAATACAGCGALQQARRGRSLGTLGGTEYRRCRP